jgi:hypothetical protein
MKLTSRRFAGKTVVEVMTLITRFSNSGYASDADPQHREIPP